MNLQGLTALTLLLVLTAAGCRREEPTPAPPPSPPVAPATAPQAPAVAPGAQPAPATDDPTITARVNAALSAAPEITPGDISVTTLNGVVQLSGFARDQAQVDRAEQVARGVEGVRSVENNLGVRP